MAPCFCFHGVDLDQRWHYFLQRRVTLLAIIDLAIMSAASSILYNGFFAALLCAACRKLYQEDLVAHLEVDRRSAPRSNTGFCYGYI